MKRLSCQHVQQSLRSRCTEVNQQRTWNHGYCISEQLRRYQLPECHFFNIPGNCIFVHLVHKIDVYSLTKRPYHRSHNSERNRNRHSDLRCGIGAQSKGCPHNTADSGIRWQRTSRIYKAQIQGIDRSPHDTAFHRLSKDQSDNRSRTDRLAYGNTAQPGQPGNPVVC